MKVYFVGAGPGDPELITVKGRRLLEECGCCIWAGSLVNPDLLTLLPHGAEIHNSAKMTLDEIIAVMSSAAKRGVSTVRLHTGDPSLYGAISEQMDRLDILDIPYEVIPGVSSFQAAAAALQVELTAPEVAQTVILTRAEGRTPKPERESLENLASSEATLCFFLSTASVANVCAQLIPFYGEETPAALVYKATWKGERIIKSTLVNLGDDVGKTGIKQTALILVGRALKRPLPRVSRLYDKSFSHGCRQGKEG